MERWVPLASNENAKYHPLMRIKNVQCKAALALGHKEHFVNKSMQH